MKEGDWIIYKNEHWNIYSINSKTVLLHPDSEDGMSNGSIIEINLSELTTEKS